MAKKRIGRAFNVFGMIFFGFLALLCLVSCIWQTVVIFRGTAEISINQFGWPLIQAWCVLYFADMSVKHQSEFRKIRRTEE